MFFFSIEKKTIWNTLPETNIAPENRSSQKETSLPTIHSQVLCWFQGGYSDFTHNLENDECLQHCVCL